MVENVGQGQFVSVGHVPVLSDPLMSAMNMMNMIGKTDEEMPGGDLETCGLLSD